MRKDIEVFGYIVMFKYCEYVLGFLLCYYEVFVFLVKRKDLKYFKCVL